MKLALIGGAAGLAVLSGCAGLTERTGISEEQQICLPRMLAAIRKDPEAADLRLTQQVALAIGECRISTDEIILKHAEGGQ